MFSILNHALSLAITSFGNKFCLKKRPGLIKVLDNSFYVKFMQLEIGLLFGLYDVFATVSRYIGLIDVEVSITMYTYQCIDILQIVDEILMDGSPFVKGLE